MANKTRFESKPITRHRIIALMLAALIFSVVWLQGCSSSAPKSPNNGAGDSGTKLPVVKIQGLTGGLSAIAVKAMVTNGFDKKNGFEAEAQFIDADAASANFLLKKSDISFDYDVMNTAIARNQGRMVTTFYPVLTMNNAIIVRKDSPYQTPKDLIGKKVGHFGADSATTSSIATMLKNDYNIDVFKDYKLVQAGPAALVDLLAKGEVEAIFDFDPHTDRALVQGPARIIYDTGALWKQQTGGNIWLTNITAYEDWIKKNKDLAYAVREAWNDTAKWLSQNPAKLKEEPYKSLLGQDDPKVLDQFVSRVNTVPFFTNSWTAADVSSGKQFVTKMAELKIIDKDPGGVVSTLEELVGSKGK